MGSPEQFSPQIVEQEKTPVKDISNEFLTKDIFEFSEYLRTLRKEPALSITIDWKDQPTALRLKSFLESNKPTSQKRFASIRATLAQKMQAPNAFASRVKWIEIKE